MVVTRMADGAPVGTSDHDHVMPLRCRGRAPSAPAPALCQAPIGDLRLLDAPSFLLTSSRRAVGTGRTPLAASRWFA